jgi:hypothetical protein
MNYCWRSLENAEFMCGGPLSTWCFSILAVAKTTSPAVSKVPKSLKPSTSVDTTCGYTNPGLASVIAQNSPTCEPSTPRKLLESRHAFGYDSSKRPNAAIRPRTSYRPNRTEHAIARRKRYPFAGKRVTAFIGPILPLQSRTATRQQRSCSASACFDTEVRWVFARQRSGSSRGGPKGFAGTPPIPRGTRARSTRIPGRSEPCRAPRPHPI